MEAARFLWWMAAAALVLPFVDIVQRTFGLAWVERATRSRLILAVLEAGTLLLWIPLRGRWKFLPDHDAGVALAGAVLALTGALLAAWAKARLGRLFSPQLGVQREHRLITTGPYGVVRHPIYLGIIDFLIGSSIFWNDVALFVVALLFILFFRAQIAIEEQLFARHFGAEWTAYSERTPRLFPRLSRRQRRR